MSRQRLPGRVLSAPGPGRRPVHTFRLTWISTSNYHVPYRTTHSPRSSAAEPSLAFRGIMGDRTSAPPPQPILKYLLPSRPAASARPPAAAHLADASGRDRDQGVRYAGGTSASCRRGFRVSARRFLLHPSSPLDFRHPGPLNGDADQDPVHFGSIPAGSVTRRNGSTRHGPSVLAMSGRFICRVRRCRS